MPPSRSPRLAPPLLVLATLLALLLPRPASAEGRLIVVHSPIGHQFLTVGAEAGVWIGAGSISSLPAGATEPGPVIADGVDVALPLGPVTVGLSQVLRANLMFEARVGGGATLFLDDRFVSTRLQPTGRFHAAWTLGAELLGRYFTDAGLTLGLAVQLATLGLPEATGSMLRVGPRVGWMSFDETCDSYFTLELGASLPFINGLIPDFSGVRTPPIDATWTMLGLYAGWGL